MRTCGGGVCKGEEDHNEIKPAVAQAVSAGIDATGPIPPDSVFRMAGQGQFDVVVTMYHDQGQIAVKTAAFAGACTVYINLPYIQLSVPHGTAFDIAGRGVAQPLSMASAIRTAAMLAAGKGFLSA
jgi:4-hydroxythreonine-4-phosphate dehydrogenase